VDRAQRIAAVEQLRAVLAAIEAGEVESTGPVTAYLRGATDTLALTAHDDDPAPGSDAGSAASSG
jgi:hypothetical protein